MIMPPALLGLLPNSLSRPVSAPQTSNPFPLPISAKSDSFQSLQPRPVGVVAGAYIRPALSSVGAFMADVLADGTIVRSGLMGKEKLGAIDLQGNYKLLNGLTGNVFERRAVEVRGLEQNQHPFALALKAVEKQRAIKGSEIPLIRAQLTAKGINGQGIRVGILDPLEYKNGQWQSSSHTSTVKQIISDVNWGVAPACQIEELGECWDWKLRLKVDDPFVLQNAIIKDFVEPFNKMAEKLQKIILNKPPDLRVLNLTFGFNRVMTYIPLWEQLNEKNENGVFKYPILRKLIFKNTLSGTVEQQFQSVINYYDSVLDNSPVFKQAHLNYIESTRQCASNGLILVTATGNEHNTLPIPVKIKPGSEMNEYAKSPYVISVGATSTRQTPSAYTQYEPISITSNGDGYWNPTVLAPGSERGISFSKNPFETVVRGTSIATPYTCGVIALMLQRNPWMTFEQVKAKLETTATPLPGYQPHEQGAGVLNVVRAVL